MKLAADFRAISRNALRGKWGLAVIAGLIAMLLGGIGSNGPEVKLNIDTSGAALDLNIAGQTIFSTGSSRPGFGAVIAGGVTLLLLGALVMAAIHILLGSVVGVGYARFNLSLVDHSEAGYGQLFQYFPYWSNAVFTRILKGVYIFLWSLLFIIPGIIAAYSYAMTDYILAEHPEMSASDAIALSKKMMQGNKYRLFCLHFSFIGWSILCAMTLGIGNLWLTPYENAANAAFFREISGTEMPRYEFLQ